MTETQFREATDAGKGNRTPSALPAGLALCLVAVMSTACDGLTGEDDGARGPADSDSDAGVGDDGGQSTDSPGSDFVPELPENFNDLTPTGFEDSKGFCFVGKAPEDVVLDCDDASCAISGACCVGQATCCDVESALSQTVDFGACADGSATSCVDGAVAFGSPSSTVADGVFYARGDVTGDSGIRLGDAFTLSSRRRDVTVRFRHGSCDGPCLEVAAVGLVAAASVGADETLSPALSLLSRGGDGTVNLIIGGATAASWDTADLPAGEWYLGLTSAGSAEVAFVPDDAAQPTVELLETFSPAGDLALVLYGRNDAVLGPASEGIEHASVAEANCDAPSEWASRTALSFAGDAPDAPGSASLRAHADKVHVAYDDGGAVFTGTLVGTTVTLDTETPAVSADLGHEYLVGGVSDPELVRDASNTGWLLFFTGVDGDGRLTLGRANKADTEDTWTVRATPVMTADEVGAVGGDLRAPSVLRHSSGQLVLLATVRDGGATWLEVRKSSELADGVDWRHISDDVVDQAETSTLGFLTLRDATPAGSTFDRDEVAEPSLHEQNRAFHVYYAGKRGSRWGIGLLTSDDLVHWRAVGDGAAMLAHDGSGFDGFGLAGPDAVFADGEVTLVYTGLAESGRALGIAKREAPALAIQAVK